MEDTELEQIKERLDHGDRRMNTFQTLIDENRQAHQANAKALAENTEITKEIKEILDMGRSFFKFLGIVGKVFKWIATVSAGVAVVLGITHTNVGGR